MKTLKEYFINWDEPLFENRERELEKAEREDAIIRKELREQFANMFSNKYIDKNIDNLYRETRSSDFLSLYYKCKLRNEKETEDFKKWLSKIRDFIYSINNSSLVSAKFQTENQIKYKTEYIASMSVVLKEIYDFLKKKDYIRSIAKNNKELLSEYGKNLTTYILDFFDYIEKNFDVKKIKDLIDLEIKKSNRKYRFSK